jgi:N-acetylglutamate synthase-like GNAT family acetyltransferase
MPEIVISAAHPSDLPAIRDLISEAGLPLDGFGGVAADVIVARDEASIVIGTASLEHHGRNGLIRSVAVDPAHRGGGVGSALAGAVEARALSNGFESVYLLTETAQRFFSGRGYQVVARDSAPGPIAESVEWSQACGVSAIAMMRAVV